jgi:hypothetical protein
VRRNADLALLAAATLLAAAVVELVASPWARALPGCFLVLFAPGYALTVMLFPAASLERLERALLALGLSIAIAIVGSVAVAETPARLDTRSWLGTFAAVTLAAAGAGAWRRSWRAEPSARPAASARPVLAWSSVFARAAMGCAVVALVAAAVAFARQPAANVTGYTLLWAVPKDAARGSFALGVTSDELQTTSYLLKATSGRRVVLERRLTLRPGETWRASGSVGTPGPLTTKVLDVVLYRLGSTALPYRHVDLSFGQELGA